MWRMDGRGGRVDAQLHARADGGELGHGRYAAQQNSDPRKKAPGRYPRRFATGPLARPGFDPVSRYFVRGVLDVY
jgi:hypothetical protein